MKRLNEIIKQLALESGFTACGIGMVSTLHQEKEKLENWLDKGYHATMNYMTKEPEKRLNPGLIMDGAKSIIMLAYHYAPDPAFIPDEPYKIARFALGLDYHTVLKEKMEELVKKIQQNTGPFKYRVFTDSAPILEKAWAIKTGIAWMGKNTLIQIPGKGSYFLLCEILCDLELPADEAYKENHCGNCRRCLDACPGGALKEPFILDSNKCLSYLSFEFKGEFPEDTKLKGHLIGCDVCQEVCPFNKPLPFNKDSWLKPKSDLASMKADDWNTLDLQEFNKMFKESGILRIGFNRLVRNLLVVNKK